MDAGLSLFLFFLSVAGFGLLFFRFRDAFDGLYIWWLDWNNARTPAEDCVKHEPVREIDQKPVRADTNALEPALVPPAVPVRELVPNHDSRLQLIDIMAAMVDDTGKHVYSANYICEVARGTRSEVLERVRMTRGASEPQEPYDPRKHLLVQNGKEWIAR